MIMEPGSVPVPKSCYLLEKTNRREGWSLLFVFGRREHIRTVLRGIYLEPAGDPGTTDAALAMHLEGETADLWLIEEGRLTGRVDLRPFIHAGPEANIDWAGFDAAVPASLKGPLLGHGERLELLEVQADFSEAGSELLRVYERTSVEYGMQVWMDGVLHDDPYGSLPDPDPGPSRP